MKKEVLIFGTLAVLLVLTLSFSVEAIEIGGGFGVQINIANDTNLEDNQNNEDNTDNQVNNAEETTNHDDRRSREKKKLNDDEEISVGENIVDGNDVKIKTNSKIIEFKSNNLSKNKEINSVFLIIMLLLNSLLLVSFMLLILRYKRKIITSK
tara:strand:+ start:1405 stop:1863 length:459 start_codon:yes stop_codon:yes gene_type:complete